LLNFDKSSCEISQFRKWTIFSCLAEQRYGQRSPGGASSGVTCLGRWNQKVWPSFIMNYFEHVLYLKFMLWHPQLQHRIYVLFVCIGITTTISKTNFILALTKTRFVLSL
jgi:hypothetical protein